MRTDILDFHEFYRAPLGKTARDFIAGRLTEAWGAGAGLADINMVVQNEEALGGLRVQRNELVEQQNAVLEQAPAPATPSAPQASKPHAPPPPEPVDL